MDTFETIIDGQEVLVTFDYEPAEAGDYETPSMPEAATVTSIVIGEAEFTTPDEVFTSQLLEDLGIRALESLGRE